MDLSPYESLQTPIWVYDIQRLQMVWANRAAFWIWDASDLQDLLNRDFSDVSEATKTRLLGYLKAFEQGHQVQDSWTFYPNGKPVSVQCFCSGIQLADGRMAMLVEGHIAQKPQIECDTLRSVEALRHSTNLVSLFDAEGRLLMQNPAAMDCYGDHPTLQQRFLVADAAHQAMAAVRQGVWRTECQVQTLNGPRWHRLELRNTQDPVTGQTAMLLNETDISDRKHSETQRQQLEQERQRIEKALHESAIRYHTVVHALAEGVVLHQANGAIIACNASAEAILGLSAEQLLGKKSVDAHWHVIREDGTPFPGAEHPAMVTLQTGAPQHNVMMGVHRPDGTLRWIAINTQPICRQGESSPHAVVASFTDITTRKQAEDELRAVSQRLQAVLTTSPAVIYTLNPNNWLNPTFISPNVEALTGYSADAAMTSPHWFEQIVLPSDWPLLMEQTHQWLAQGAKHHTNFIYRLKQADGRVIWVDDQTTAVRDQAGNLVEFIGAITDVTEQVDSDRRLKKLAKNIPGAIFQFRQRPDGSCHVPYVSQGIRSIYGISPEALRDNDALLWQQVPPEDRATVQEIIRHSATTLIEGRCEYRLQRSGETRWLSAHATPEREPDGSILWHGYLTDITWRKAIEDTMRISETTKQAMLEAIPDLLLRMDHKGTCLDLISGGEVEPWRPFKPDTPQPLHEILPAPLTEQRLHYIRQALTTGKRQIYHHAIELQGRLHQEEVRIVPINDNEVLVMARDITDRVLAEQALRESEARWQFALEGSGDGVWDWDAQTNRVYFSQQWKAMLGYEADDVGTTLEEWDSRVHPDDKAGCYQDLERHFRGETPIYQNEHRIRCKDGTYKWILDRGKVIEWDDNGQPKRVIGTHTDMTERHNMEQELRQQAEMLQAIFDHIPIMLALINPQGKIQTINKATANLLGWTLEDWQTRDILAECYPDPHDRQRVLDHIIAADGHWQDMKSRTALGSTIDTAWNNIRLSDGNIIGIGQDITERKQWENYLQHLATHDKLTALPNRYQFDEYLAQEWKRLTREQRPLALILCDIDQFKAYNDTLGHIAGDHCLIKVARAIASVIKRPADLATRYGGEEFAVILPNTDLPGAKALAETIRQTVVQLAIPHPGNPGRSHLTLSLGVACVYPCAQLAPEHLTAMADGALYQAKATGRNRYCIAE